MSWLCRNDHRTEHSYTEERLSAYLDGELTPKERAAVDRHLETCRECRLSLETLRQTVRWTRGLQSVPIPRMFTIPASQVSRPARAARPVFGLPVMRMATVIAAVLLFVTLAGDYVLTGFAPQQSTQSVTLLGAAPAETAPGEGDNQTFVAPAPSESSDQAPAAAKQAYEVVVTQIVEATVVAERSAAKPTESAAAPGGLGGGLAGAEPALTATSPAEKAVVETVVVEAMPTATPEPTPILTVEVAINSYVTETQLTMTIEIAPTASPTPAEAAVQPGTAATAAPAAAAETAAHDLAPTEAPAPAEMPAPTAVPREAAPADTMAPPAAAEPELAPTQPGVVAMQPPEPQPRAEAMDQEQVEAAQREQTVRRDLRLAEIGLGAVVGLLALTTVALALRERARQR